MVEKKKRSAWGWVRLGILVFLLLVTVIFGVREFRYQNRGWKKPQSIVVVIAVPNGSTLVPGAIETFRSLETRVESTLAEEIAFHGQGRGSAVDFFVTDPVTLDEEVPKPRDDGLLALLEYNLKLARFVEKLTERAGLRQRYETVLVLIATPGDAYSQSIEGVSQFRGHFGIISADLRPESADFAWFVTVHEYLHTRGATDKYSGTTLAAFPDGYAEPEKVPTHPQTFIELMARGRPTQEGSFAPPGSPATWRIGPKTAQEIGLTR